MFWENIKMNIDFILLAKKKARKEEQKKKKKRGLKLNEKYYVQFKKISK